MDFHHCKDLPVWAQILVDCDAKANRDTEGLAEPSEDLAVPDENVAA
ncbi:hypothetical protein [Candidatus Korobacter versatilis]|nr:hypothetical protein [Candidatus Koribacter versatilis]